MRASAVAPQVQSGASIPSRPSSQEVHGGVSHQLSHLGTPGSLGSTPRHPTPAHSTISPHVTRGAARPAAGLESGVIWWAQGYLTTSLPVGDKGLSKTRPGPFRREQLAPGSGLPIPISTPFSVMGFVLGPEAGAQARDRADSSLLPTPPFLQPLGQGWRVTHESASRWQPRVSVGPWGPPSCSARGRVRWGPSKNPAVGAHAQGTYISAVSFVFGHTQRCSGLTSSSMLRNHFWWGSGGYMECKGSSQVRCMQGKSVTHWTNSPTLE